MHFVHLAATSLPNQFNKLDQPSGWVSSHAPLTLCLGVFEYLAWTLVSGWEAKRCRLSILQPPNCGDGPSRGLPKAYLRKETSW